MKKEMSRKRMETALIRGTPVGLISGLMVGLAWTIATGQTLGLFLGLCTGLICGLCIGLLNKLSNNPSFGLTHGLVGGVICGLTLVFTTQVIASLQGSADFDIMSLIISLILILAIQIIGWSIVNRMHIKQPKVRRWV